MGLSVASLEDGSFGWMNIGGQRLYGGATLLDDDTYVLCAVTSDEILASRTTTVTIILFAVFVALTLVVTYAFFILRDCAKKRACASLASSASALPWPASSPPCR